MTDSSIWRVHGTPLLPPVADGSPGGLGSPGGRGSLGPLSGLGVAVKDVFAVGGFPLGGTAC